MQITQTGSRGAYQELENGDELYVREDKCDREHVTFIAYCNGGSVTQVQFRRDELAELLENAEIYKDLSPQGLSAIGRHGFDNDDLHPFNQGEIV